MGNRDEKARPYKRTFIGRVEAVLVGILGLMKRTGAGSIAIAIGALGAGALLATTLVFPPPPVQRVFQTPAGGNGNDITFDRPDEGEDAIQVPTDKSEAAATPSEGPDDGLAAEVLAALESRSNESAGATIVASTETGGIQLDKDGATPGGQGPDTDKPGEPAEKPDDDDDDDDGGDDGDDDGDDEDGDWDDKVKKGAEKAKHGDDGKGKKGAEKAGKHGDGDDDDDDDDDDDEKKIGKHSSSDGDDDDEKKIGKHSSSDGDDDDEKKIGKHSSSDGDDDDEGKGAKKAGKHSGDDDDDD